MSACPPPLRHSCSPKLFTKCSNYLYSVLLESVVKMQLSAILHVRFTTEGVLLAQNSIGREKGTHNFLHLSCVIISTDRRMFSVVMVVLFHYSICAN